MSKATKYRVTLYDMSMTKPKIGTVLVSLTEIF